jgi:hypothetical protein
MKGVPPGPDVTLNTYLVFNRPLTESLGQPATSRRRKIRYAATTDGIP